MTIDSITVLVAGRPAPQGSKRFGEHGQMREQSAYLPAWRAAVKRACYARYRELGVVPADLPLFVGAVEVLIEFNLAHEQRVDGPPDLDKLTRATWDALTAARVWEDDSRVVRAHLGKNPADGSPGAVITVVRCVHDESRSTDAG